MIGKVVKIISYRGFYFIRPLELDGSEAPPSRDVFALAAEMADVPRFSFLTVGATVEYQVATSGRGPRAVDVVVLN